MARARLAAISRRTRTLLVLVAVPLAIAGCGGSSPQGRGAPAGGEGGGLPRYFGDHPGQQARPLAIDRSDCRALDALLERQLGRPVRRSSEPSPPSSRCRLSGPGAHVSVFLDAAYAARQRYTNRMEEQVQFNAPDPARVPHQVPGVGDPAPDNHYASWIPAYSTLFAVRGNRWLTVAYAVAGESRRRRLAGAVALARLGFRRSAR